MSRPPSFRSATLLHVRSHVRTNRKNPCRASIVLAPKSMTAWIPRIYFGILNWDQLSSSGQVVCLVVKRLVFLTTEISWQGRLENAFPKRLLTPRQGLDDILSDRTRLYLPLTPLPEQAEASSISKQYHENYALLPPRLSFAVLWKDRHPQRE